MATVLQALNPSPIAAARYQSVRSFTEQLCAGLEVEDYVVQSMDDVSPTKWHLAHTTWFFETFVLSKFKRAYTPFNATYPFLFNSYYVQAGERHCRAQRGYISRPTVSEVFAYRKHVDEEMDDLIETADEPTRIAMQDLLELGLNHEQQHQELMLTDIKHVFSVNPLRPAYRDTPAPPHGHAQVQRFIGFEAGVKEIGHSANTFAYDNETPRHREFVEAFEIADRLVTNGEYMEFMQAGGYHKPELWLSAGWDAVQRNEWKEPFYWEQHDGQWQHFTLSGMREVNEHEPVCHISYFEADAFARWSNARLPTEAEWETAVDGLEVKGNFVESGNLHPVAAEATILSSYAPTLISSQMFGDAWQWTRSQYSAYPGFNPAPGAVGEYNGKFMCNQFVLRGGSCATSITHIRPTYRNFFAPDVTWQFSGIRLARDV